MSTPTNHSRPVNSAASLDGEFDAVVCEISEQIDNGVYVELSQYEQQHPELADRLRRIWPTLLAMADLGHLNSDESVSGTEKTKNVGTLGDFQIIREVGRGGMGVVYEATQLSLGRRVALKVLPFASVMDKRQLQRFKNEAMAAAALEHPNIVSVHATGCERSVHYYAMHYVEGHTLAEIVSQLRASTSIHQSHSVAGAAAEPTTLFRPVVAPAERVANPSTSSSETRKELQAAITTEGSNQTREYFRSVAEIGKQAADGLDYAHGVGIVHRDIKPSNLILDENGRCWITDFGLAMAESSPNLTMTGDLLGTLRYMSPEQSLAQRVVIDHRTDIYSLGVTLYELLTLQPAHTGDDREELLRRLTLEEPTTPHKINPSIPSDMETIVLKAISKNPADRYATASDLAADLQRYLDGHPIQARRPTVVQRAFKWSNRHKPLVATSVVLVLLTMAGLAASIVLIAEQRNEAIAAGEREQEQRAAAQSERDRAQKNLYLAEMRQAAYDLSAGSMRRLAETLERYEPRPGAKDFREWEWYYLSSQLPRNGLAESPAKAAVNFSAFCWTEDPQRLLAAGDPFVSVWDPAELKQTRRLAQQESTIKTCDVHDASGRLATGAENGSIKIWELRTGRLTATLQSKGPPINWLGWSADGSLLATFDKAFRLVLWEVGTGKKVAQRQLKAGFHIRWQVPQWSPSGKQIAGLLITWKDVVVLNADNSTHQLQATDHFDGISWARDGTSLVTAGSGRDGIQVWDAESWEVRRQFGQNGGLKNDCTVSPDGKLLATTDNESVDIWTMDEGRRLAHLSGHAGEVNRVVWSPNGRWLASTSRDSTIRLWSVADGYRSYSLHGAVRQPDWLSFSPDGSYLVSWCTGLANGLQVWPTQHGSRAPGKADLGELAHARQSPNGEFIAGIDENGDLVVWDARTHERVRRRNSGLPPASDHSESYSYGIFEGKLSWSPDGQSIAWVDRQAKAPRRWNLKTDKIQTVPVPPQCPADWSHVGKLHWSPDSRKLAATSGAHLLTTDVAREQPTLVTHADLNYEPIISWGPRNVIAVAGNRADGYGYVHLRDGNDCRLLDIVPPETSYVRPRRLAWANDGTQLAVGYERGQVQIIDAEQGRTKHLSTGHSSSIRSMAFTPTGSRLASLGNDTIRIWDVESGAELLVLDASSHDQSQPAQLTWGLTGAQLALVAGNGQVDTWDATPAYDAAKKLASASSTEAESTDASNADGKSPKDSKGPATEELDRLIISAYNEQQQAWVSLESGNKSMARKSLTVMHQKLQRGDELRDGLQDTYLAKKELDYLWGEFAILSCRADAFELAIEAVELFNYNDPAYRDQTRQKLWHYCIALARTGKQQEAREIYDRLVESPLFEPYAWDGPLLVAATQLMVELTENQTAEDLLGADFDRYRTIHRELLLSRAKAHVAQKRWDEAARDNIAAIELTEDSDSWQSDRKKTCLWATWGAQSFPRAVELRPDLTTLWIARGQTRGLRRDWTGAVKAYKKGFVSRSVEDETIFEYAAALLLANDSASYEELCRRLTDHPTESGDSFFAFVKARTCALRPSEHVQAQQLIEWAEARFTEEPTPWNQHLVGLARYRAGHFDQAIEHLETSNASGWAEIAHPAADAQNWLVLAMCHHQLGRADQAAGCLATAKDLILAAIPPKPKRRVRVPVPDWMEAHVLLREAEALLRGNNR